MAKQTVREMEARDIPVLVNYWMSADERFLRGMGVDTAKMPSADEFSDRLHSQIRLPLEKRISYCLIWELDGEPVGQNNTNPTVFGEEATMHLHMWKPALRRGGLGLEFIKLGL